MLLAQLRQSEVVNLVRQDLRRAVSIAAGGNGAASGDAEKKTKKRDDSNLSQGWSGLDVHDFAPQDVRFVKSGAEGKVKLPPNCGIEPSRGPLRDGRIVQQKTLPFFKLFVTDEMIDLAVSRTQ